MRRRELWIPPPFCFQLGDRGSKFLVWLSEKTGGGPRVVVSTAAFHARVRGSVPSLPHPRVKVSIVGSLRDREVACSASDRQGSNFESCVWRTVSSQSSHHPQEVLLAQFSLYVHKGGLKPDSFHLFQRKRLSLTSALHLFCLCNVKRHYRLPGKLDIYCFLTDSSCHSAAKRPYICSLVKQVYTSFTLMSLTPSCL